MHYKTKLTLVISILRCSGRYNLVLYQAGFEPPWIRPQLTPGWKRFGHVQGMDGDQIAYAAQASEAAFIVLAPDIEVKVEILKENFSHTDEYLYIAITSEGVETLQEMLLFGNGECKLQQINVQFEVKHSYFDALHRAVSKLPSEIIERLVPEESDFKAVDKGRIPFPKHYEDILKLDEDTPCEQVEALKIVAFCPSDAPPVLISGAFGTGKTRLLAAATYLFVREGQQKSCLTRVLICAHHQASADTFLECYLGLMEAHADHPWRVKISRLTSNDYKPHSQDYARWYLTVSQIKTKCSDYIHLSYLLIVTTYLTALQLHHIFPPGFFTHILLDEGAQAREPEAVASLSLATKNTKIVIAGDPQQVS